MKTREFISALQVILDEQGDLDVIMASDAEGNSLAFMEDISIFDADEDVPAMLCLWPADGTIDV